MNRGKILTKNNKTFKIRYGTVDNKDIKSVFINFSSWVALNTYSEKYSLLIKKLKKRIQKSLYENASKEIFMNDLYIVDLDIRESGLKNSIQTFMSLEINLFKKENLTFKDEKLTSEMLKLISLIEKELDNFHDFEFSKEKKKIN